MTSTAEIHSELLPNSSTSFTVTRPFFNPPRPSTPSIGGGIIYNDKFAGSSTQPRVERVAMNRPSSSPSTASHAQRPSSATNTNTNNFSAGASAIFGRPTSALSTRSTTSSTQFARAFGAPRDPFKNFSEEQVARLMLDEDPFASDDSFAAPIGENENDDGNASAVSGATGSRAGGNRKRRPSSAATSSASICVAQKHPLRIGQHSYRAERPPYGDMHVLQQQQANSIARNVAHDSVQRYNSAHATFGTSSPPTSPLVAHRLNRSKQQQQQQQQHHTASPLRRSGATSNAQQQQQHPKTHPPNLAVERRKTQGNTWFHHNRHNSTDEKALRYGSPMWNSAALRNRLQEQREAPLKTAQDRAHLASILTFAHESVPNKRATSTHLSATMESKLRLGGIGEASASLLTASNNNNNSPLMNRSIASSRKNKPQRSISAAIQRDDDDDDEQNNTNENLRLRQQQHPQFWTWQKEQPLCDTAGDKKQRREVAEQRREVQNLDGWDPTPSEISSMATKVIHKYRTANAKSEDSHTMWSYVWEKRKFADDKILQEMYRFQPQREERSHAVDMMLESLGCHF